MIDPKIQSAIEAALASYAKYNGLETVVLAPRFREVFSSSQDFLKKVDALDAVFDDNPKLDSLREVFFDLLLVNFFSEDVKKLEEDYLETKEWENIEEETLDRGTELLNVLLYLNECEDEDIEPSLDDYLKEFLLVDEDEFQDEHRIYEPVIVDQILMESPVSEIARVAKVIPQDAEIKEIFYPMMCFFQDTTLSDTSKKEIAANASEPGFDMAIIGILGSFK